MKEKRYALMFDGTMRDGILTGTAEEVAREFNKACGFDLKVDRDEDGRLGYFIRLNPKEGEEGWDPYDYIDDQGTVKANLIEAHRRYFEDFILEDSYSDFRAFKLDTPERKELFEWSHDELLDHITVREFRDAELDYDEEYDFNVRRWYYENKCPAPESGSKAA